MKILNLLVCAVAGAAAVGAIGACGDDTAAGGAGATGATSTVVAGSTVASSTHAASTSTGTAASSGSGSNIDCSTLCDTYGGAVPTAAGQIVDAAVADPEFQPFFQPLVDEGGTAVADFKTSLGNFIAVAYGCAPAATYTGPDMMIAHTGLDITSQEYDDFVTLIAGVLHTDGVPDDYIGACFAPALTDSTFKATIVGQ